MTEENQDNQDQDDINDIDAPVDEKLLAGGDDDGDDDGQDDQAGEDAADDKPEGGDIDPAVVGDGEEKEGVIDTPNGFVKQSRFNYVYAEAKALKERLALLEGQQQPTNQQPDTVAPTDLKALRREATAALLEGDTDKHDELQDQIYDELQRRAEAQVETRLTQRAEAAAFKAKVTELTEAFPVLNPETGDPEAIELVVELRDSYIAKGMSMTEALEKAVRKIAPKFGDAPNAKLPDEVADARKVAAIKRGVQANNAIPPQGGGVGNRAMPPSKSDNIPQGEWESMSPAARQKHLEAAG